MSRVAAVLLLLMLTLGAYLVQTSHDTRQLYADLDRARTEAQRLDADHERLLAERHAQATNLRVEQVARERLRMRPITPAVTQSLHPVLPAAAPASAASSGVAP
ncbi:cell division protein FtsL [Roseateles sp. BYS180W]|uniref:Cell division protein FtsL n=1 Tax=Roseateles rivi TaxID=3299028 RepID=A0ABW7FRN0_9BURK